MTTPANWYPDPAGSGQLRYWDGSVWTEHLAGPEPVALQPYRRPSVSGVLSIVGIAATLLAQLILAVLAVPSFDKVADEIALGSERGLVWTAYDTAGLLAFVVMVAAGIASCVWLWAARCNAEALRPQARHARARGWVWGSWICPVVSLWFPYQCVRDVTRATAPDGRARVGWWWAAYLVFSLLVASAQSVADSGSTIQEVHDLGITMAALHGVIVLIGLVAGGLWILNLVRVDRDQAAAAKAAGAL